MKNNKLYETPVKRFNRISLEYVVQFLKKNIQYIDGSRIIEN